MKWLINLGLIAVLSLPLVAHAQALQWQPTNGPWGGSIECFIQSGSSILAGTGTGGYRTTNKGATWSLVDSLADDGIQEFTGRGAILFALGGKGIYRSLDSGNTWHLVNAKLSSVWFIEAIDSIVFAVENATTFKRSVSGGIDWVDSKYPWQDSNNWIRAITSYDNILLIGTDSGIYRTSDFGTNWERTDTLLKPPWVAQFGTSSVALYAGDIELFRSKDSGKSWGRITFPVSQQRVRRLYAIGPIVYAVMSDTGVYRSLDTGNSWARLRVGPSRNFVYSISQFDSTLLVGTDKDGVYRSNDDGKSWDCSSEGIIDGWITGGFAASGTSLFAGSYGIYRTTDDGTAWLPADSGLSDLFTSSMTSTISVAGSRDLYATMGQGGGVCRTTDEGESWAAIDSGLIDHWGSAFGAKGDTLFDAPASPYGLFRSTNRGLEWTQCSIPAPIGFVSSIKSTDSAFFVSSDAGVFRTFDAGDSWTRIDTGALRTYKWPSFTILDAKNSTLYAAVDTALYRSVNNGQEWTRIYSVPNWGWISEMARNDNSLIVRTDSGIFVSVDAGKNWLPDNEGLPPGGVFEFCVYGSKAFASTRARGVFVSNLPQAAVTANPTSFGLSFDLFPNPTSDFVTLCYDYTNIPATIAVTDVLGREVARPFTQERATDRVREITLDLSKLPAGTYFLRIETASGSTMRKVIRE